MEHIFPSIETHIHVLLCKNKRINNLLTTVIILKEIEGNLVIIIYKIIIFKYVVVVL